MKQTRVELQNGEIPGIAPYNALHLPFTVEELYAICKAQSIAIQKEAKVRSQQGFSWLKFSC